MRIKIPKAYDRVMDWLAYHIFPPDKQIRNWHIGSVPITWLDVTLALYALALCAGFAWWYGAVYMFFVGIATMVIAWLWWGWK